MINGGRTIHTANGSTVTIRPRGVEYDLETRNAKGETINTVVMHADDVADLMAQIEDVTGGGSYNEGYNAGYEAGRDVA